MFHKILVAVDNSPISNKLFDEAVYFAKKINANLMLYYVLAPFENSYFGSPESYMNTVYPTFNVNNIDYYVGAWEGLKQEGIKYLQMLCNQAKELGIVAEYTLHLGDPGRNICEFASNWEADLIIIGRRGHRGLNELFLGSVSNYVMHHAPCSVLTVQGTNIMTLEESKESREANIVEAL
jgi:nucleotide-binding universal stress UspA family protein